MISPVRSACPTVFPRMQIWSPIVASMTASLRCCDCAAVTCTPVLTAKAPSHTPAGDVQADTVRSSTSRRTMDGVNVAASPIEGRQVVDVSFLLAHASHVLATRMTAAFAEIGITPREYCVLAHAMGGQYTQIELAKLADLDKTTMLNTMDYLEREGYAQRSPSPADRRARIITVTAAGTDLVAAGHEIADRVHREVLEALPESQRGLFTDMLTTLVTDGPLADAAPF